LSTFSALLSMEPSLLSRRVQRVRHERLRRELQVVRREALGSDFVRLVLGGPALAGFVSLGFDDHVKLILQGTGDEPARRDYTPRRFDAERLELTIDFALHGDGVAANWARQAQPGQPVLIGGPRGSMVVDPAHDWHLLAGDDSAAPAIGRRLAELPATARAIVIVQLQDLAVLDLTACAARVELQRVDAADGLLAALRAFEPPAGEGYLWVAGEASVMAAARDHLLHDMQWPKESMRVAAYWKRGASDHHEDLVR